MLYTLSVPSKHSYKSFKNPAVITETLILRRNAEFKAKGQALVNVISSAYLVCTGH